MCSTDNALDNTSLHRHAHEHPDSNHSHSIGDSIRTAFFLNLTFTVLEVIGGLWTNSVAILSDALHDLGDSISLGAAWIFERFAQRAGDTNSLGSPAGSHEH